MSQDQSVTHNPWQALRQFTDARIALGRVGSSLPTRPWLDFQLAHAQARDAVQLPLDVEALRHDLASRFSAVLQLHSAAPDRTCYLNRPDLGRQLDEPSQQQLQAYPAQPCDVTVVVADGLSALAVQQNAVAFLDALLPLLKQAGLSLGPVSVVQQGRVAAGDQVGELLKARVLLLLIGERPGLSSPDSMGLYLTYAPKRGCHDAQRNCISNIRPAGQVPEEAAQRAFYLIREALRRGLSGVNLKDETQTFDGLEQTQTRRQFRLAQQGAAQAD